MPTCTFCKKTTATVEDAIDAGWIPTFFAPAGGAAGTNPAEWEEIDREACPACVAEMMDFDASTGYILRQGWTVPTLASTEDGK